MDASCPLKPQPLVRPTPIATATATTTAKAYHRGAYLPTWALLYRHTARCMTVP